MIPRAKVNGVTVSASGKTWCYACHGSERRGLSAESSERDEFGYPVAGTWPGEASYESTANAHRLIPETTQTVETGAVRRDQGDCLYCHSAHGSENAYDGLLGTYRPPSASTLASDQASGTYADACFRCHGGVVPSGLPTDTVNIKQFVTAGGQNSGHRIRTAGGLLPVGSPLPCYECHGPHGSTRENKSLLRDSLGRELNTGDAMSVRRFCFSCHTTGDTGLGWDSVDAVFESVAGDLVVGLSRDATSTALRLPAISGHREADGAKLLCVSRQQLRTGRLKRSQPGVGCRKRRTAHRSGSDVLRIGLPRNFEAAYRRARRIRRLRRRSSRSTHPPALCATTTMMPIASTGQRQRRVACRVIRATTPRPVGRARTAPGRDVLHTPSEASDVCIGCHSATLPRSTASGLPTVCGGCHIPHAGSNQNASCDTCHASVDVWSKSADCSSCHGDKFDGLGGAIPHSGTAHVFAPSDFDAASSTGCTNSGAGCHGSELTNGDFTMYHPNSGCTTGACHTSASKAAFAATYDGDSTCASCHDSNYAGAPDVVALVSAVPNGHYDETSHEASATSDAGERGRHRERHVRGLPCRRLTDWHGTALRPASRAWLHRTGTRRVASVTTPVNRSRRW